MTKLSELQSRPPTLHFTSRCDARHLATLALLWQSRGEVVRSTSELVRLSLETFTEVLITSGQVSLVPTQEEAQEILGSLGLLGKGIQKRNLISALTKEGNFSLPQSTPLLKVSGKVAHDSPDLLRAARELEEVLSDPDEFLRRQEERSRELRDMLGVVPEGGGE